MNIGEKVYIENPVCGIQSGVLVSIDGPLAVVRVNKASYWEAPRYGNKGVNVSSLIPSMQE